MTASGADRERTAADVALVLDALARREAETRHRAELLGAQLNDVVEAAVGSNADDEHDPEGATLAFERQQVAALLRQAEDELVELAAARDRVAAGTFGRCEVCGAPIGGERLVARPTARTCVACAGGRRDR